MFEKNHVVPKALIAMLVGATFVTTGCDRREREERARAEVVREMNEAAEEIGEAQENLGEATLERERADLKERVGARLATIDDRLDEVRANVRSTPGINDAYDTQFEHIEDAHERIKERLDDADEVEVEGWALYRNQVDGMVSDLETRLANLERRIWSRPTT